jgi:voltage-gated potassium channel
MILEKKILDDSKGIGKLFAIIIQILIFISLITFSVSTIPNLTENQKNILDIIEMVTVFIFTFEYILRIILVEKKLKFIFSFYGLIDLLSILPFYLTSGLDLRSLRTLRLLRLFRIFKLMRYNDIIKKYSSSFFQIKGELLLFFSFTFIIIYIAGVGIYYFENEAQPEVFDSIFSSLWWALITLTTVGYGDAYPITAGGKIFTTFILMIGLGIVAIPTGLFASALSNLKNEVDEKDFTDDVNYQDKNSQDKDN